MSLTRIRGESDLKVASHLSHENVNAPIHISTKTSVGLNGFAVGRGDRRGV